MQQQHLHSCRPNTHTKYLSSYLNAAFKSFTFQNINELLPAELIPGQAHTMAGVEVVPPPNAQLSGNDTKLYSKRHHDNFWAEAAAANRNYKEIIDEEFDFRWLVSTAWP